MDESAPAAAPPTPRYLAQSVLEGPLAYEAEEDGLAVLSAEESLESALGSMTVEEKNEFLDGTDEHAYVREVQRTAVAAVRGETSIFVGARYYDASKLGDLYRYELLSARDDDAMEDALEGEADATGGDAAGGAATGGDGTGGGPSDATGGAATGGAASVATGANGTSAYQMRCVAMGYKPFEKMLDEGFDGTVALPAWPHGSRPEKWKNLYVGCVPEAARQRGCVNFYKARNSEFQTDAEREAMEQAKAMLPKVRAWHDGEWKVYVALKELYKGKNGGRTPPTVDYSDPGNMGKLKRLKVETLTPHELSAVFVQSASRQIARDRSLVEALAAHAGISAERLAPEGKGQDGKIVSGKSVRDRKSTRLNSSHELKSRMPSSA